MPLTIGSHVGSHEITALLGKGGMGEVYRARDIKLMREVAIKVLSDEFSHDADRVGRFQREAQVLASLNHPNIASIYDLEEQNGSRYLVLELVDGETLADRIARRPFPVDEALQVAIQICEALEAAHDKGIIHRDLKPANVKITPAGKVKVLDFGLAKTMDGTPAPAVMSNSPTLVSTMGGTQGGVILGTAAYMSPEQARGKEADRSSDIWAFGCVLYEMLTGRAAFEGETIGEILAGVFKAEPAWRRLPSETPEAIRRLLRRCLEKDRMERFNSATDARIEIKEALSAPSEVMRIQKPWLPWIAAVIAALAIISIAGVRFREKPRVEPREMRLEITTPSTSAPLEFALSPDGRYIAFVASGAGQQRLWLRALDKTEAHPLAGTEGADSPFWSPDSRSIGFFASGGVKRIDITGGAPQTLAINGDRTGGSWNADGTILIRMSQTNRLARIAASGGNPAPLLVTGLMSGQSNHGLPQFLPDDRHFLFVATGNREVTGIYLGSLDGAEPKRLAAADSAGAYLSPEMIVFVRGTTLVAQHLDLKRWELTGDPLMLADSVAGGQGSLPFSASADGRVVAYRAGGGTLQQLSWYDRSGKILAKAAEPDSSLAALLPELSPDGTQVALQRNVQGNLDVWLIDLVRGGLTRFTSDPAGDGAPVWSPDGMKIAFNSAGRKGPAANIYVKPSRGPGAEELLLETPKNKLLQDWSKDGRFLLYLELDPKTGRDLWALPTLGNDRRPIVVVNTPFDELKGQFSPDGNWVAYQTNESGRFEIVVQPFPEPTVKWQVSKGGGTQPRWRADGKEIYFIAPDGKLMAAPITSSGAAFAPGPPAPLFSLTPEPDLYTKPQYAVSRDGRFLISQPVGASTAPPITLILNWKGKR